MTEAIYDTHVEPWERLLTCCRCGLQWNVTELPTPWINPDKYVCPTHLKPKKENARGSIFPDA